MIEALFEILVEAFGEFFLQVFFEALARAGIHFIRDPDKEPRDQSKLLLFAGYVTLGAIGGAISLWLLPNYLLRSHTARLAYLVLAPAAAGGLMALIGVLRSRLGQRRYGIDRFFYGYVFALAFALVRFQFAG